MMEDEGGDTFHRPTPPSPRPTTPDEPSSPWRFHDAPSGATPDRPRLNRHSSLPKVLFATGGSSLFGSSSTGGIESSRSMKERGNVRSARQHENALSAVMAPPSAAVVEREADVRFSEHVVGRSGAEQELRFDDHVVRETRAERRVLPRVEKDADDPTATTRGSTDRQQSNTMTTLSRLFMSSRQQSSYMPSTYTRNLLTTDVADLPKHLYTRGLREGRHSDITVHAFGHQYRLHRLILDRAPFFTSALSAPWLEAHASDIALHPEDVDPSITQNSFELALKRLYGCHDSREEDGNAVGLFATGCWLEMQDLVESAIESILRHMNPSTLSPLIKLVTSNYYGRAGDKILASAKSMLCRDGWRMPLRYWDGIPSDIIREIVGGDGFFIDGEWDRWVLARRILDRRLRARAIDAGLIEPGTKRKVRKAPNTANVMAVRFDGVYRKTSGVGCGVPDALNPYVMLYTHADIEPILVLLDEGIHYIHLDFEQLQFIRGAKDCLGLPVMPEKVLSSALWQQMELRQRVVNARESEMELGLSIICSEDTIAADASRDTTMSITTPASPPTGLDGAGVEKGKHKATDVPEETKDEVMESGSWDGNGKPRKFWIPTSDCNIVMGGNADPVIATSNNTTLQRHAFRSSGTFQPEDIQWASDFTAITSQPRPPPTNPDPAAVVDLPAAEVRYTHFPPFRFAAEFPNPRLLKEKKRVYSRTVFYAGSLWNIYIQKVATSRSKQLGVYLHRAKERETEEVVFSAGGTGTGGSVDERIGQLEREMILRSEQRDRRRRRDPVQEPLEMTEVDGTVGEGDGSSDHQIHRQRQQQQQQQHSILGGEAALAGDASSVRSDTVRSLLSASSYRSTRRNHPRDNLYSSSLAGSLRMGSINTPSTTNLNTLSSVAGLTQSSSSTPSPSASSDEDEDDAIQPPAAVGTRMVPTLTPYVDARPTIRTYFKIYSPSRGGKMLSVYESAPDRFNFSQSWGWKSSTLMLDEGLFSSPGEEGEMGDVAAGGDGGDGGGVPEKWVSGEGKLRFMVVVGNI